MLFAHAGYSHGAEGCYAAIALAVAGVALVLSVVAVVIAIKKSKKR